MIPFHETCQMSSKTDQTFNSEPVLQEFLNEFNNFDAEFDDEWVQKFFGRRPDLQRKNFEAHLDEKFLKSCQNDGLLFEKLKIDSREILDQVKERYICENCFRSRKYFCYQCYTVSPYLIDKLPRIRLPVKVDIIKHSKEVDGKSTSPHAAILAPQDVRIFTYPNLPKDWPEDLNRIFLIFPKKDSPTIGDYLNGYYSQHERQLEPRTIGFEDKLCNRFPIERVVFIDSTWRQTGTILNDELIKKLPTLVIKSEETMFWRYHKRRPVHYLSTIEAIYYLMVQMHSIMFKLCDIQLSDDMKVPNMALMNINEQYSLTTRTVNDEININCKPPWTTSPYEGQFDNLLYFFKHTYYLIKERYRL